MSLFRKLLGAKKIILFYILALLSPVLILIGAEFALRFTSGYQNTTLIQPINNHSKAVINTTYFDRYYSSFNPSTSIAPFSNPRDTSVIRILSLGGSTMAGYPYSHHFSPSALLEINLKKAFPGTTFEVINTSITAFNSFGIVDITSKMAELNPDIIMIYAGHNEFYGTMGSASAEGVSTSALLRRSFLNLYPIALFQFSYRFYKKLTTDNSDKSNRKTTMSRLMTSADIPLDESLFKQTMFDFHENLMLIFEYASRNEIPIAIATVVSNLKDQLPLGENKEALNYKYLADSIYVAGDIESARRLYQLARDYDPIRFRAPSHINSIIRGFTQQTGSYLVDIDQSYKYQCASGIEDASCFTDHLHPNYYGYKHIAQEFYNIISPIIEQKFNYSNTSESAFVIPELDPLEKRLADINIQILKSSPPFTNHSFSASTTTESILNGLFKSASLIDNAAYSIITNHTHPAVIYENLINTSTESTSDWFYSWSEWSPLNEQILIQGINESLAGQTPAGNLEVLLLKGSNEFNKTQFYNILGARFLLQRDYNNAKNYLQIVENRSPNDTDMLYNMAVLHDEIGKSELAIYYLQRYQSIVSQSDTRQ
ncbi:MAG TPA: hypothetical protein DCE78_09240 [Bacteroidetes bacterium]|nr:hypothetical protein [Bacteroidota bacterium]